MRIYAFYFRESRRTSIARVGAIEDWNTVSAEKRSREIVKDAFPDGVYIGCVRAERSLWPVKRLDGTIVAPSQIAQSTLQDL